MSEVIWLNYLYSFFEYLPIQIINELLKICFKKLGLKIGGPLCHWMEGEANYRW